MRIPAGALPLAGLLLLALLPARSDGQTIRGRVTELETGQPVVGAPVVVRHATGRTAGSARTDDEGRFVVGLVRAGAWMLEASAPGFAPMAPVRVRVEDREEVLVALVLARQVIAHEPLVVTGRRRDPRHDATWQGALARRQLYGRLGSQRVYMHGDVEMGAAVSIVDVIRGLPAPLRGSLRTLPDIGEDGPRRVRGGCNIVYWNGNLVSSAFEAAWMLDAPPAQVEAVEVYRTWHDAPSGLRGVPSYVRGSPADCSVVALWYRTGTHPDDPARRGRLWVRSLVAVGIAAVMLLVLPAL
jgi:hypothetical protein